MSKSELEKVFEDYEGPGKIELMAYAKAASEAVTDENLSDGYPDTDKGNSARFEDLWGDRVKYVQEWQCWATYSGGVWSRGSGNEALVAMTHMGRDLATKAAANHDTKLYKVGRALEGTGKAKAALEQASGRFGMTVSYEDFDKDPYLLNVRNGVLDLRTGRLKEHSPEFLMYRQAPTVFDPEADCPVWEKVFKDWQPDPAVRDYLQLIMGSALTGIPTEYLFINYGGGRNGKSKFYEAIRKVLGPYAVEGDDSLVISKAVDKSEKHIHRLFKARLLVCAETESGERLNEALVKKLTGGDRLVGRRMREDAWEFDATHTAILHTNNEPAIRGYDKGIKARIRIIPWTAFFPEGQRDLSLSEKLNRERSGILNWLLEGCKRWLDGEKEIPEPSQLAQGTEEYLEEQDIFKSFLDECIEFVPSEQDSPATRMKAVEMLTAFNKWQKLNGRGSWAEDSLRKAMKQHGHATVRKSGKKVYLGVRLVSDEIEFDDSDLDGI